MLPYLFIALLLFSPYAIRLRFRRKSRGLVVWL